MKNINFYEQTVFVIERLTEITSQPPATPHEQWFQTAYNETINEALDKLKNPAHPNQPHASWQMFKQVMKACLILTNHMPKTLRIPTSNMPRLANKLSFIA